MSDAPPRPRLVYPAGLLTVYLLAQLLLLAWSAFPGWTMRAEQLRESWAYLVGLDVLFVSWVWPMLRMRGAGWRQAALEAGLLVAASVPAAVPAIHWVDASASQVLAPAGYALVWLLVGLLAVVSHAIARWAYCLLATTANLGLVGLGYLWLEFLAGDAWPIWRLSPMACASQWAESGWPDELPDQIAGLAPVALLLVLLVVRVLRPGRATPAAAE